MNRVLSFYSSIFLHCIQRRMRRILSVRLEISFHQSMNFNKFRPSAFQGRKRLNKLDMKTITKFKLRRNSQSRFRGIRLHKMRYNLRFSRRGGSEWCIKCKSW
ncbi:Hypothetical_protein [Hexamita inflata]|uniref:Hypothetical_protein n=1 Tax=Hexamita inflata TaxID=28002 RepID=A0AA86REX3_9EUKA|nr:Hypothetical protein HINF_LOCUS62847 [Hexamita inflata]